MEDITVSDESKSGSETAKPKTTTRKTTSPVKKKPAPRKTAASAKSTASTARKPRVAASPKTAKKPVSAKTAPAKTEIVPAAKTAASAGDSNFTEDTKARASELVNDAKARISNVIANLGGLIADSAGTIEDRLGSRFGDIARSTSENVTSAAKKVGESDLGELAEDTRQFVRKSPAIAIGLAVTAGFVVARLLKSANDSKD